MKDKKNSNWVHVRLMGYAGVEYDLTHNEAYAVAVLCKYPVKFWIAKPDRLNYWLDHVKHLTYREELHRFCLDPEHPVRVWLNERQKKYRETAQALRRKRY